MTSELAQRRIAGPLGFLLHERIARHFAGYWKKFVSTRQKRSSNFLLHWKVCTILWVYSLKIYAPTIQKNFGWHSRQWNIFVSSRVLKGAYNKLTVYLGNIFFWSFWWSWSNIQLQFSLVMIKHKLDIIIVTVTLSW